MRFDTYIPCERLRPFITHFAISEMDELKEYKILPDTSLVMGFQYKGRISFFDGKIEKPLSAFGITGLLDSYRVFKNLSFTGSVLVYFREGGAANFFRQPLQELFQESVSLDHFMLRSELLLLEERLCEAKSDKTRIAIVEKFLLGRMRVKAPDALVTAALTLIHKHQGDIRIADLAKQLFISQSPLEKRFRKTVGTSPKKFASIVKVKAAINNRDPRKSFTEMGYDAGFYDQAHFVKVFRSFTGETPEKFFGG